MNRMNSVLSMALSVVVVVSTATAQPQGFFTDVTPILADPNFSDFVTAASPDGLTLYFTSFNRSMPAGNEDMFVATRTDTNWPSGTFNRWARQLTRNSKRT